MEAAFGTVGYVLLSIIQFAFPFIGQFFRGLKRPSIRDRLKNCPDVKLLSITISVICSVDVK